MKFKLIAIALMASVAWVGCSNSAATDELNAKIEEQAKMLTDTVGFYMDSIAALQAHVDSLEALLAPKSTSQSTTSGGKTPPPPPKDPGKIDVTTKGSSGGGDKIDVTKKGGTNPDGTEKKIDVTKKGSQGTSTSTDE